MIGFFGVLSLQKFGCRRHPFLDFYNLQTKNPFGQLLEGGYRWHYLYQNLYQIKYDESMML